MPMPDSIALYIHVPFCETKCPYCDFNTYSGIEGLIPGYVAALKTELHQWGKLLARPAVTSIFFGGGTPSYLPTDDIGDLMGCVRDCFDVQPEAEITLEANPGDVTPDRLRSYLESGLNRLSIGVQSFDDELLKVLGRRHTASEAMTAYHAALEAGFSNVSIDLMYGLPYQDMGTWQATLETAVELSPPHISMYCLTLEGGTPMEQAVALGQTPEPDADLAADMYLAAQDAMREQGYRHYEISNWSKNGPESLHNLAYWRNQPYLGVGPGAHSYLPPYRFSCLKSPRRYIDLLSGPAAKRHAAVEDGDLLARIRSTPTIEAVETIDRELEMAETMMMGLRLDDGIGVTDFTQRFGKPPVDAYADTIAELESLGLLTAGVDSLRLTHRGRMLGNEVFSRFF